MPIALIAIGVVLLVSALRDTYKQLGSQLQKDFTGSGNFIYWVLAIIVIGMLGYINGLSKFSKAFMLLILLGFILSNKGFFAMFTKAVQTGTAQAPATETVAQTIPGFDSNTASSAGITPSSITDITKVFDDFGSFGL